MVHDINNLLNIQKMKINWKQLLIDVVKIVATALATAITIN